LKLLSVTVSYFHPSLIFLDKNRPQAWSKVELTNTLAYFSTELITAVKIFNGQFPKYLECLSSNNRSQNFKC